MKIVARGWEWEFTKNPTQWIAFECKYCGYIETHPSNRSDGYRCPTCNGGPYVPKGYVRKVKEVKSGR